MNPADAFSQSYVEVSRKHAPDAMRAKSDWPCTSRWQKKFITVLPPAVCWRSWRICIAFAVHKENFDDR